MSKQMQLAKPKLSRQLLSAFGASLVIFGLASGSITYLSLRHNLEQQVKQRAESITQGLEFASEGLIETHDTFLLERIVQNYATLPTVIEVSIVDPDGILIAHSNGFELMQNRHPRYTELRPTLSPILEQVSQGRGHVNRRLNLRGKMVVVNMLPFSSTLFNPEGKYPAPRPNRGVAIAILDLEKMEREAWRNTLSSILSLTISAALILVLMGWLIQRLVLSPLQRINLAITQSEHQGSFSLPPLPNNEVGFLGTTFAGVFKQLKAYQQMELEIAERKYAEIAQRYKLATHAAKVWVWDWDIETDSFLIDQDIQEWLGFSQCEVPNRLNTWIQSLYQEDQALFFQILQTHLEGKTAEFSCEHRLLSADGAVHWFLSRGQVVSDQSGKPLRAIGTMTDIAERKQAEAQLQQANEELLRATRLKDEFLANMSHELRTPLNAILGMTEGLQEEVFGQLQKEQVKALDTIERSASHLLELINEILDLAKIESGQMILDCVPTIVTLLCQSSLTFIKQPAQKKQIKLDIKIPRQVPDLLVDERRIRQVLINLLNNAVKFTPEGGKICLQVTHHCQESTEKHQNPLPQFLRIAISDTGIGIAPEDLHKLFQPFVQIDSALNRQYQGTGLGLALVKRIVELHGGQIQLTSEVGVGSCFTIDLPCVHTPLPSPLSEFPSPTNLRTHQSSLQAVPLILLAEDNEANVMTISSYLKAKGYRILLAKTGQETITLTQAHRPDLILMDIQMPGIDGFTAIQEIRSDPDLVAIPIIAVTALAMPGDLERCLAAGANDYLSKPIQLKQLVIRIQQLLTSSGKLEEQN